MKETCNYHGTMQISNREIVKHSYNCPSIQVAKHIASWHQSSGISPKPQTCGEHTGLTNGQPYRPGSSANQVSHSGNKAQGRKSIKVQFSFPNKNVKEIWEKERSNKGPVKLIQRVKIAHSFLQSVSNLFHFIILSLPM